MTDEQTTIQDASQWVLDFSKERNWEQVHNPQDLTVALVCEVGEILEHFRYKTNEAIDASLQDPQTHRAVAHEIADCFWLVLRLAEVCKVDLASALHEKLRLAALKYPVEQSYGRADNYTAYQTHENDGTS